jgi:hypothetical protein
VQAARIEGKHLGFGTTLQQVLRIDIELRFTRRTGQRLDHDKLQIEHSFNTEQILIKKMKRWVPRINAGFSRYIHIDIGLTHDALGLAMVHLAGNQQAQTLNDLGEGVTEDIPIVCADLLLQVRCRPGDQIDLNKIARFVIYLSRFCGYPIDGVSFDQFQSAHISQILRKQGFPVTYVSVDRTETAYLTLATLIQNEVVSYYEYPILLKELRELRRDLERRKVRSSVHIQRRDAGKQGRKRRPGGGRDLGFEKPAFLCPRRRNAAHGKGLRPAR